ncbi:MAG: Uma2 family endonuclease [Peptococcaceae bacterium]|nr:Uma2 family endonuclease [Peptococcaceae bacterium]
MSRVQEKQEDRKYSYQDYCAWDDKERWELIEGAPYNMSPAPSRFHQKISSNLHRQLANFLHDKSCEVYPAPFDVRLNAEGADDTVVQPDLVVICDRAKLDDHGCVGVPDMVVEITSPSTARHDRFIKFQMYRKAGVREFWIVDPETKTAQVFILENGQYIATMYGDTDTVPVHVLEGCEIDLQDVFADLPITAAAAASGSYGRGPETNNEERK